MNLEKKSISLYISCQYPIQFPLSLSLLRAVPVAYGSSQAKGGMGAKAVAYATATLT